MQIKNPSTGSPSDTQKSQIVALGFATSKRVTREWMPYLSDGELRLVLFLLTQTLERGNRSGHYHEVNLLDGFPVNEDGTCWGKGTGLSRSILYRSMKTAVSRGLIQKQQGRTGGWHFTINTDWNPTGVTVEAEGNIVSLKFATQPKKASRKPSLRAQMGAETAPDEENCSVKSTLAECQIDTHTNNNLYQDEHSSSTTFQMVAEAAPRRSFQEENLENSTEAVSQNGPRATRRPRASATPVTAELPSGSNKSSQRGSTKADSKTSPEKAWKDAWKEAHSSKAILETRLPAPWTNIDRAKIATVARKWDEKAYGPFADFIMFTVCNWKTIMRKHFAWMKEDRPAPSQPEVGFLCAAQFLPKIIEAFCDAETLKWVGLDPRVGREIEWQMENGLTREAAILKVAQMHMEEADRKQRAADIATAKRHLAMAELVLDRSRKEVATREKYRPGAQPAKPAQESFAPATDRDPNAPIIAEQADFSAWDLN